MVGSPAKFEVLLTEGAYLIADGRRDMQSVLGRRLLGAYTLSKPRRRS